MAKYARKIKGDFNDFVNYLKESLVNSSMSASLEEESYFTVRDASIAVLAFERYSYFGSNRVGMTVTIASCEDDLAIVGMSVGGSQAVLFKINRLGESSFLQKLSDAIDEYLTTDIHSYDTTNNPT